MASNPVPSCALRLFPRLDLPDVAISKELGMERLALLLIIVLPHLARAIWQIWVAAPYQTLKASRSHTEAVES